MTILIEDPAKLSLRFDTGVVACVAGGLRGYRRRNNDGEKLFSREEKVISYFALPRGGISQSRNVLAVHGCIQRYVNEITSIVSTR